MVELTKVGETEMREVWVQASDDELPDSFRDPRCADFRCICSNGFEGSLSLASAFRHKPSSWPQCFPDGPNGEASCTSEIVRRAADTGARAE